MNATKDKTLEAESKILRRYLNQKRVEEEKLTLAKLGDEIGLKSRGQVSRWFNGNIRIPDQWIFWLGDRLEFSPVELRPSLAKYAREDAPALAGVFAMLIEKHGKEAVFAEYQKATLAADHQGAVPEKG